MILYAKIIDQEVGRCDVGLGSDSVFYKSIGMTPLDVQQSDIDNQWYLANKCPMKTDEQKELEERERIAKLNLTGADVERGIYQAKGMDFEDIIELVETLIFAEAPQVANIDLKALKIELKANHFYRGNPYVSAIGGLLGFTIGQLDKFFETNDYTYLIPEPDVDNPEAVEEENPVDTEVESDEV